MDPKLVRRDEYLDADHSGGIVLLRCGNVVPAGDDGCDGAVPLSGWRSRCVSRRNAKHGFWFGDVAVGDAAANWAV
ncbi:hypothetical protein D3C84_1159220 [compost metagenome]